MLIAGVIAFLVFGPQPKAEVTADAATTRACRRAASSRTPARRGGPTDGVRGPPGGGGGAVFSLGNRILTGWRDAPSASTTRCSGDWTSLCGATRVRCCPWPSGPTGGRPVSSGADNRVCLRASFAPEPSVTLPAPPRPTRAVAFSRDGKLVLTANEDGNLRVYDASNGREVKAFPTGGVQRFWACPPRRSEATPRRRERRFPAAVGHERRQGDQAVRAATQGGLHGRRLPAGRGPGRLRALTDRAPLGRQLRQAIPPARRTASAVLCVAVSSSGRTAPSGPPDGVVSLWDLRGSPEGGRLHGARRDRERVLLTGRATLRLGRPRPHGPRLGPAPAKMRGAREGAKG